MVRIQWGDYQRRKSSDGHGSSEEWERTQRTEDLVLELPKSTARPRKTEVSGSNGLKVALSVRTVTSDGTEGGLPKGTRSVSVFLVNRRQPSPDEKRDEGFAFQAQLEVKSDESFIPARICVACIATTGTSAWPTCNSAMPASSPWAIASLLRRCSTDCHCRDRSHLLGPPS